MPSLLFQKLWIGQAARKNKQIKLIENLTTKQLIYYHENLNALQDSSLHHRQKTSDVTQLQYEAIPDGRKYTIINATTFQTT
jgi:hypothetical protein